MVVGDHAGEPERLRQCDQRHAGDAAVHRHHQLRPAGDRPHRRLVEAVALAVARGQVDLDLPAERAQIVGKDRRSADAVDVVVAVDADRRAVRERRADHRDRGGHIAQLHWIAQLACIRRKIAPRRLGGIDSALDEQRVQRRVHVVRAREVGALRLSESVSQHVRRSFPPRGAPAPAARLRLAVFARTTTPHRSPSGCAVSSAP